ncbi:hypothetical protein ONZ45_g11733 [Pleurotus djamor]|nr:hypothetical protein ONZ45_g11733 [Pleurotus djamor]
MPSLSLAPVQRGILDLPDEITIKILHLSYRFCPEFKSNMPNIHDLRKFTPSFWTTIPCSPDSDELSTPPEVIAARLSHTGTEAPLNFRRTDLSRYGLEADSADLILAQLHRLEELNTFVGLSYSLNEKLRGRAPLLKALELGYRDNHPFEIPTLNDPQLFGGAAPPQLTSLTLCSIRVPWNFFLLAPTLTLLELRDQTRFVSYQELYDTLSSLPNLEDLRLVSALPPSLPSTDPKPDLVLPRLRKLWLSEDHAQSVASVLRHLRFQPSAVSCFPNNTTTDADILSLLRGAVSCFPRSLVWPSPSSASPLNECLPTFMLSGPYLNQYLWCQVRTTSERWPDDPPFIAAFCLPDNTTYDLFIEKAIKAFPLKKIESFALHDYSPLDPQHFWMNIVGPTLKYLKMIEMSWDICMSFLQIYLKYLDTVYATTPSEERLFTSLQFIGRNTPYAEGFLYTVEEEILIRNVNEKRRSFGLADLVVRL